MLMKSYKYATQIVQRLTDEGYTAYFAGGWVRDYLLENPSADIDIATDAPPSKIITLFPKTIQVGINFGVVVVVIHGCQFEVSTFRKDLGYDDGRHPSEIELSDPYEDAQRRDFTINGMFYDPATGEIIDYVGGKEDLAKGIVRAIGNPYERFREDRLRMIRAVRFSARFGYPIEELTRKAIQENAPDLFPAVAMERIWQEFEKMTEMPHFDQAVLELDDLRLLRVIFPTIEYRDSKELAERVEAYHYYPRDCPTILYIAGLFPRAALEDLLHLSVYLKISSKYQKLVEFFWKLEKLSFQENVEDYDWARFLANPVADLCIRVIAAKLEKNLREKMLTEWVSRKKRLRVHVERIREKKPLIGSSDLKREGIEAGKQMGELLREAEKISVNHDLNEIQQVMALLKQSPLWES